MESLLTLILLAGGGMFAYRQWKMIQAEALPKPRPTTVITTQQAEVFPGDAPSNYTVILEPEPATAHIPSPQIPGTAKKIMIVAACAIWIICPLDGDFVPVLGWLDDVAAAVIAYRTFRGKA